MAYYEMYFLWNENENPYEYSKESLVGSVVKKKKKKAHNYLPMQEKQVWSLGGEDLLEEVMATHSSILA